MSAAWAGFSPPSRFCRFTTPSTRTSWTFPRRSFSKCSSTTGAVWCDGSRSSARARSMAASIVSCRRFTNSSRPSTPQVRWIPPTSNGAA
ncbi:unnamed protein product [Symbiodinium natans]|uniref:Uncharacterized protein n=1 Tax=Symbiodinium natans TaxID=878477 RepID=A0A812STK1_9DINO|nr:unnamed protein product [Symbiodinium natans]